MSEQEQQIEQPVERTDINTVTSETLDAFHGEKLGWTQEEAPEVVDETEGGEKAEESEVEAKETDNKAPEQEQEKPAPKKNGFQERISEITAEKKAAQAEAQREREARMEAERRLAELTKPQTPEEQAENAKPTLEQFNGDVEMFTEALTDWKVDQKLKADEVRKAEEAVRESQRKLEESWRTRVETVKAEIPDYDQVLEKSDIQIHNAVKEAILESDVGPYLAHHLAANPEFAAALKSMSLPSQLRELGKLEAKFEKSAPAPKPSVEVSKAPAPISPIKSNAPSGASGLSSDGEFTGSHEEYVALRRAGKIK